MPATKGTDNWHSKLVTWVNCTYSGQDVVYPTKLIFLENIELILD